MAKQLNYNFLDCAAEMPALKHQTDRTFDIMDSEVCNWLVSRPEIRQKIFNMAVNKHVIKYNAQKGAWQGVGYDD